MENCNCPNPALCEQLKKHINGRLWEIWNSVNIDPKVAESYRRLWQRQAGMEEQPVGQSKRGCKCGKK